MLMKLAMIVFLYINGWLAGDAIKNKHYRWAGIYTASLLLALHNLRTL